MMKMALKTSSQLLNIFCSLVIHYFDVDSEDSYMPCNVMAHFNKLSFVTLAQKVWHFGILSLKTVTMPQLLLTSHQMLFFISNH